MKRLFITSIFIILFAPQIFSQSTSENTAPHGKENNFPPFGNVGIGTRYPSTDLEVYGYALFHDSLSVPSISSSSFKTTSLNVLQNARVGNNFFVGGNSGFGVTNPTERLEVLGNLKASNNIYSNNLSVISNGSFGNNLSITKNLLVSGNVGIGVDAPTEKLDIAGSLKASNALYSQIINSTSGSISSLESKDIKVSNDLLVSNNSIFNGKVGIGLSNPSEKLDIAGNLKVSNAINSQKITSALGILQSLESGDVKISNQLTVNNNSIFNGNVGIGLSNPSEKLDIAGNLKVSETISSQKINSNLGVLNSLESKDVNVSNQLTVINNTIVNGRLGIGTVAPTEKLDIVGNIKVDGNISANTIKVSSIETPSTTGQVTFSNGLMIGSDKTLPSGFKLAINGGMKATFAEIQVYSQWPDYVFEKSYNLKSLKEVETFINENKHLPGVPSAVEVEQKGINLGEMDEILLKKIEELTLYMIELKKDNEELKKQNQLLKEDIEALKK